MNELTINDYSFVLIIEKNNSDFYLTKFKIQNLKRMHCLDLNQALKIEKKSFELIKFNNKSIPYIEKEYDFEKICVFKLAYDISLTYSFIVEKADKIYGYIVFENELEQIINPKKEINFNNISIKQLEELYDEEQRKKSKIRIWLENSGVATFIIGKYSDLMGILKSRY